MCHGARALSILISFNFFFSKSIIVYAHINPTSTTSTLLPYDLDFASVSLWPRLCVSQMLDVDSASVQLKTLCLPRDNLWPLQLVFKPWNSPLSISSIFFLQVHYRIHSHQPHLLPAPYYLMTWTLHWSHSGLDFASARC